VTVRRQHANDAATYCIVVVYHQDV
jgi:hypothetical protein